MKTYRFAGLLMALIVLMSSCSNSDSPIEPQMVDLKLDFTLSESGSMSRATGSDVYDAFYEESIKTKKLTPKTYHLEFRQKSSSVIKTILEVNGLWEANNGIRLPEGEYTVTGYSRPIEPTKKDSYTFRYAPSDSVYLSFKEDVAITKDMSKLELHAIYDSYLLLFDTDKTKKIIISGLNKEISSNSSVYWIFVNNKEYGSDNYINGFYYKLSINRKNGDNCQLNLEYYPFEMGKYYYFNDMTNSFDIPKMESGN